MSNNESPIFVVGMDRSGTTLMSALLDAHSRIAIAPETWFIWYWTVPHQYLDLRVPEVFESFWEQYSRSDLFSHLGLDREAVREEILRLPDRSFQSIFTVVLRAYARRFDKPRWGEKSPDHYRHLDVIFDWYPQARVLFMLRDPRAVFASYRKVPTNPDWPSMHACLWRDSIEVLRRWETDPRFAVVKYESLVADPPAVLRSVCDFVGEPYEERMLDRSASVHRLARREGWWLEHQKRALAPISTESVDRWRRELSRYKVAVIEHFAGEAMDACGYGRETAGLTPVDRCRMRLGRIRGNLRGLGKRTARRIADVTRRARRERP